MAERRDCNDWDNSRYWVSPQLFESSNAVDTRKLNIHQDEGGMFFNGELKSFFRGFRLDSLVALDLEHIPSELGFFSLSSTMRISSPAMAAPVK
jgi:hypothetical protein